MTISKKLYTGMGLLALTLVVLMVYSQVTAKGNKTELEEIDHYREIQATIAPRIIDHMKWAKALAVGSIQLGKEFTGRLDHTKCKFGEWYYFFQPPQNAAAHLASKPGTTPAGSLVRRMGVVLQLEQGSMTCESDSRDCEFEKLYEL